MVGDELLRMDDGSPTMEQALKDARQFGSVDLHCLAPNKVEPMESDKLRINNDHAIMLAPFHRDQSTPAPFPFPRSAESIFDELEARDVLAGLSGRAAETSGYLLHGRWTCATIKAIWEANSDAKLRNYNLSKTMKYDHIEAFFWKSSLTEARKAQIVSWVKSLPKDKQAMIEEIIDDTLSNEAFLNSGPGQ